MWRNKGVKRHEKINITAEEESAYKIHLAEKIAMRNEKDKMNKEATSLLVLFDLENAITMPKAEANSFF